MQCDKCGKELDSEEKMAQHMRDKHNVITEKKGDVTIEKPLKPKRKVPYKKIGICAAVVIILAIFVFMLPKVPHYDPLPYSEHVWGNLDANVTIVEFSDFECPSCGAAYPTVNQLKEEYAGRIQFIYKHFPLPSHPYAQKAAQASECASDQGQFWEMYDKLFQNQEALTEVNLKQYAADLGFNQSSFNACLDSGATAGRVSREQSEGNERGVDATPTFFINNQKLVGARPISEFRSVIDAELAKGSQ